MKYVITGNASYSIHDSKKENDPVVEITDRPFRIESDGDNLSEVLNTITLDKIDPKDSSRYWTFRYFNDFTIKTAQKT